MKDYRCRKCGRLLFRSDAAQGKVQAICPDRRCRTAQLVFLCAEPTRSQEVALTRYLVPA